MTLRLLNGEGRREFRPLGQALIMATAAVMQFPGSPVEFAALVTSARARARPGIGRPWLGVMARTLQPYDLGIERPMARGLCRRLALRAFPRLEDWIITKMHAANVWAMGQLFWVSQTGQVRVHRPGEGSTQGNVIPSLRRARNLSQRGPRRRMPKWLQEIETEVRRAAEIERQQAAQREGPATPPAEPPWVDLAAIRAALRPDPQTVPGFLWQAVKRAWQPPGSVWDWTPGEVQSVTAYTDGSMRQGATGPSMGFGACIRVRLSNAWGDMTREGDFQGRCVDGPCTSTMAELMAIAAVLAVVPPELTVAIHTDSQAAIAAMERVRSRPDGVWSGDRVLAPLMEWVAHWHCGRMGNVQLHKVKAHSGVPLNERADQLAGTAHNEGVQ
ncbi:hypothetical protein H4R21_006300, partial [Coemansia helicoidea]